MGYDLISAGLNEAWFHLEQDWNPFIVVIVIATVRGGPDLSHSSFVVRQAQQEDAGLVDLDWNGPASPLHLAHRGRLLGSCLSDQSLVRKRIPKT